MAAGHTLLQDSSFGDEKPPAMPSSSADENEQRRRRVPLPA